MISQERSEAQVANLLLGQNIAIDERIVNAGETGEVNNDYCYAPTPVLAMVAEAADILADDPYARLAEGRTQVLPELAGNIGAVVLAGVLNGSQQDTTQRQGWTSEPIRKAHICEQAEAYFLESYISVLYKCPRSTDVVVDHNGPLLIAKHSGEETSLLLRETEVNGIRYPSGSIMSVTFDHELRDVGLVDARFIKSMSFLRLSAFAFPAQLRSVFSACETTMNRHDIVTYRSVTIGDMYAAATKYSVSRDQTSRQRF